MIIYGGVSGMGVNLGPPRLEKARGFQGSRDIRKEVRVVWKVGKPLSPL